MIANDDARRQSGQQFIDLDPSNEAAVTKFITGCKWLFGYIERRLPDRWKAGAEDVFYSTVLAACQACSRDYVRKGTPEIGIAVLYTIASRQCANFLRKSARREAPWLAECESATASAPSPAERAIGKRLSRDLRETLEVLRDVSATRCAAVCLKYWTELTDAEAAGVLNISYFAYIAHYRSGQQFIERELRLRGYRADEVRALIWSGVILSIA